MYDLSTIPQNSKGFPLAGFLEKAFVEGFASFELISLKITDFLLVRSLLTLSFELIILPF